MSLRMEWTQRKQKKEDPWGHLSTEWGYTWRLFSYLSQYIPFCLRQLDLGFLSFAIEIWNMIMDSSFLIQLITNSSQYTPWISPESVHFSPSPLTEDATIISYWFFLLQLFSLALPNQFLPCWQDDFSKMYNMITVFFKILQYFTMISYSIAFKTNTTTRWTIYTSLYSLSSMIFWPLMKPFGWGETVPEGLANS